MPGLAAAALALAAAGVCPAMGWTTRGTAGGPAPTIERSEPVNLLTLGERRILVDAGDGTVGQLARAGLTMGSVDAVVISHLHLDHAGGLGAVIGLRWMNQFPGVLTVYGPPGTRAMVDGILASLAPPARIGFALGKPPPQPAEGVRVVEVAGGSVTDLGGGLTMRGVENSHFDDGRGGRVGVSLSYRFEPGGRSIAYTGDTGPSAAVDRLAKGADLLVFEVVMLDPLVAEINARRPDAPPGMLADMRRHLATHHLPPEAIGRMAAVAGVGRVVVTHYAMPGALGKHAAAIRAGIPASHRGPFGLARDLSSYDLGCR
ncbi:MBL fold metallo-hydrolase [uncultured Sphingomonas sp.]|uniref:MBL fold metallo-hydrolase n=1 Tax=uncultured Sphingomonas sp. TaxID=158754 RepID=UPI0025F60FE8|nr:MBL fold metallo-hydrolase [uncultured Sphingomonas sp.]